MKEKIFSIKKFLLLVFFFVFLFFLPVLAQNSEVNYPTTFGEEPTSSLPNYIVYIFNLACGLGAFTAFLMIIIAGVKRMTSPANPALVQDSKDQIKKALTGLLLLLLVYVVLTTINPDLAVIKLPAPPTISLPHTTITPPKKITTQPLEEITPPPQILVNGNTVYELIPEFESVEDNSIGPILNLANEIEWGGKVSTLISQLEKNRDGFKELRNKADYYFINEGNFFVAHCQEIKYWASKYACSMPLKEQCQITECLNGCLKDEKLCEESCKNTCAEDCTFGTFFYLNPFLTKDCSPITYKELENISLISLENFSFDELEGLFREKLESFEKLESISFEDLEEIAINTSGGIRKLAHEKLKSDIYKNYDEDDLKRLGSWFDITMVKENEEFIDFLGDEMANKVFKEKIPDDRLEKIPIDEVKKLAYKQIENLSEGKLREFAKTKLEKLSFDEIEKLAYYQLNKPNIKDVETFAQDKLTKLSQIELEELAFEKLKDNLFTEIKNLKPEEVENFTQIAISNLNYELIIDLAYDQLRTMNYEQIKSLAYDNLKTLVPENIGKLSYKDIEKLAQGYLSKNNPPNFPKGIKDISSYKEVEKIALEEIKTLSPEGIKELSYESIEKLAKDQIFNKFIPEKVKDLAKESLKSFNYEYIKYLADAKFRNSSQKEIEALAYRKLMEFPLTDDLKNLSYGELKEAAYQAIDKQLPQQELQKLFYREIDQLSYRDVERLAYDGLKNLSEQEIKNLPFDELKKIAYESSENSSLLGLDNETKGHIAVAYQAYKNLNTLTINKLEEHANNELNRTEKTTIFDTISSEEKKKEKLKNLVFPENLNRFSYQELEKLAFETFQEQFDQLNYAYKIIQKAIDAIEKMIDKAEHIEGLDHLIEEAIKAKNLLSEQWDILNELKGKIESCANEKGKQVLGCKDIIGMGKIKPEGCNSLDLFCF